MPKGWRAPSGGSKTAGKAGGGSADAKAAREIAGNIRSERGLTRGQREEAEQHLYKAANHLDAGNHAEAASELDEAMHATSLRGGGIIKGSTAAKARDLRDKVRAGNAGAAPAPAPKAAEPEWKQTMDEMAARERAAGIANARGMDRMFALSDARKMHMRDVTSGIVFPHPSDLGGHPGDNGAWQASDLFGNGDLAGAADALDRQAAGETSRARAAANRKLAAQLRAVTPKAAPPGLGKVPGTQQPDGSFTALDHNGTEYQVSLRRGTVTVSRGSRTAKAPAGDNPTQTARVLAGRIAPATPAELKDAQNAVVRRQLLTPRQSEVLQQDNERLTAQASAQSRRQGAVQAAHSRDDLAAVELSAKTAMLEATPAPRGKPGGPGLYDVRGMGHTDYVQQIVKALIEKRGMDPHRAYAVARGAIRRWMRGGSGVHPEVRAAAAAAEAGELARQARAKAAHGR